MTGVDSEKRRLTKSTHRKRAQPNATFDGRLYDVPPPAGLVSWTELLQWGTAAEVREVLGDLALSLETGKRIPEGAAQWLAKALWEMSRGIDPKKALGLNRKNKIGLRDSKALEAVIAANKDAKISEYDSLDFVARYDPRSRRLKDSKDGKDVERLRKQLSRTKRLRTK